MSVLDRVALGHRLETRTYPLGARCTRCTAPPEFRAIYLYPGHPVGYRCCRQHALDFAELHALDIPSSTETLSVRKGGRGESSEHEPSRSA